MCHETGHKDNADWAHKDDLHICPDCADKWFCENCSENHAFYVLEEGMEDCYDEIFPKGHRCGQICFKCEEEIEKEKAKERTIIIYVMPDCEEWSVQKPWVLKITEEEMEELKDGGVPKHLEGFYDRLDES